MRTNGSQTCVRPALTALLLDLGLDDCERLRVEVDLGLFALLVVAVDLVAVAVNLELADLVALCRDLRLRFFLRHPLRLRVLRALRAGKSAAAGEHQRDQCGRPRHCFLSSRLGMRGTRRAALESGPREPYRRHADERVSEQRAKLAFRAVG